MPHCVRHIPLRLRGGAAASREELRQFHEELYEAYRAELGGVNAFYYQGTGNVGECLVFGKIAGENAAKGVA